MTKRQTKLWTIAVVVLSLFVSTCRKDAKICNSYTELTDHNHLVDLSPLNGAPELLDTLAKYPQLQVYKVINDEYNYGMQCNVFYKGLKVFTDFYALYKNKADNIVFTIDTTSIVDTINISLTPSIKFDKAISIARKKMNYDNTCISYRLGIYNTNCGTSYQPKNYKLIWRVQGESGYPVVDLDANSGQIYYAFDGLFY
jgi:Zn-dependent metalloprotease